MQFKASTGARSWSGLMRFVSLTLSATLFIARASADNPDFDFTNSIKHAADYFVTELPGAPEPLLPSYAGHIEVTPEHHGNLFFWLFKNRHIADRNRLVIWLNGGPGCSSMDGALMEIGPYRVNNDGTLRLVDGSWDEFANVVFVDNPVGTGFSYVEGNAYLHELNEMADNMIAFLSEFFRLFPELARNDIYIAGESYAGQHIPYIAQAIVKRNAATTQQHWNLSGLLIGNGWISGPEQYPSYLKFARENGLLEPGSEADQRLEKQQKVCDAALANGGAEHVDTGACESILTEFLRLSTKDNQCYNMYDVRLKDSFPSCGMAWPPDLTNVTPYLRRREVTKALHLNSDKQTGWTECNGQVSSNFRAKTSKPSRDLLPDLLKEMPIVLFSGDKDLICNHIGTEDMISQMEWNGGKGMELSPGTWAPRRDWTFESEPAGFYQSARNLTYVRFYNSSHMVPFDYPRRTRDMLDRFMGVDIASIGGRPADSRIDGEKGPEVSVGGHPNSTAAAAAEKDKIRAAKWAAYRRSGEVALVFALIAACAWGIFVWRERRRRRGYRTVYGAEDGSGTPMASGLGLDNVPRRNWRETNDIEAAREFDEAELDDLTHEGKVAHQPQFGLADDEDDYESDANLKEAKTQNT